MDKSCVVLGLLGCFIALFFLDGCAVEGNKNLWLIETQRRHARYQRDLPPPEKMENSTLRADPELVVCGFVDECYYWARYSFQETMHYFLLGSVSEKIDTWCSTTPDCWDDQCDEDSMRQYVDENEMIIEWMCNNRTGFQNVSCFQDPFPQEMKSCSNEHYRGVDENTNITERNTAFENCVFSKLNVLPECAGDKKDFFLDFFRYVMDIRKM